LKLSSFLKLSQYSSSISFFIKRFFFLKRFISSKTLNLNYVRKIFLKKLFKRLHYTLRYKHLNVSYKFYKYKSYKYKYLNRLLKKNRKKFNRIRSYFLNRFIPYIFSLKNKNFIFKKKNIFLKNILLFFHKNRFFLRVRKYRKTKLFKTFLFKNSLKRKKKKMRRQRFKKRAWSLIFKRNNFFYKFFRKRTFYFLKNYSFYKIKLRKKKLRSFFYVAKLRSLFFNRSLKAYLLSFNSLQDRIRLNFFQFFFGSNSFYSKISSNFNQLKKKFNSLFMHRLCFLLRICKKKFKSRFKKKKFFYRINYKPLRFNFFAYKFSKRYYFTNNYKSPFSKIFILDWFHKFFMQFNFSSFFVLYSRHRSGGNFYLFGKKFYLKKKYNSVLFNFNDFNKKVQFNRVNRKFSFIIFSFISFQKTLLFLFCFYLYINNYTYWKNKIILNYLFKINATAR
jgi:hypothetical protein